MSGCVLRAEAGRDFEIRLIDVDDMQLKRGSFSGHMGTNRTRASVSKSDFRASPSFTSTTHYDLSSHRKSANMAPKKNAREPALSSPTTTQSITTTISAAASQAPPPPKQQPAAAVIPKTGSVTWDKVLQNIYDYYVDETSQRIKLLDIFLVFLAVVGALQFIYCVLAGNYPFNAFLSGFGATVGQFVLTSMPSPSSLHQKRKAYRLQFPCESKPPSQIRANSPKFPPKGTAHPFRLHVYVGF